MGISRTAPFSAWSFGDYLSRMLPLLWIGALFFLTFFTSFRAQRTAVLTDAAPAPPLQYALIRCAAAFLGVFLLVLACLAEAAVFYGYCFGWYGWSGLLLPALITLAPPLIFALGSGWFLGRLGPRLIYVWMPVPFLCAVLPLPEAAGMISGSFFTRVSAYSGSDRPGIFPSAVRSRLSADSSGCRHRLSALSGAAGEKKKRLIRYSSFLMLL